MFRRLFLSMAVAGAMVPAAAPAQSSSQAQTVEWQRIVRTYAMCFARSRTRTAEGILGMAYLSPEQNRRVTQAVNGIDNCPSDAGIYEQLQSPPILEGMAAQLLLGRIEGDLASVSGLTDEQVQTRGLRPRNGYEDLSLCMVRTQPALVRDLVMSEPGSTVEQAAFRQLVPHVGSCVAAGQNLSLDRRGLRSVLAVGLYRVVDNLRPRT